MTFEEIAELFKKFTEGNFDSLYAMYQDGLQKVGPGMVYVDCTETQKGLMLNAVLYITVDQLREVLITEFDVQGVDTTIEHVNECMNASVVDKSLVIVMVADTGNNVHCYIKGFAPFRSPGNNYVQ